jgi:hypothetical protein
MKPIFTGESFFENVRKDGGVYIDKTEHIYNIFNQRGYYFLSRPRRFGKSLLCSTIAALFRGEKELFEGLWIENHWDFSQVHPVIHLDMTKASNTAEPIEKVSEKLVAQLQNIAEQYDAIATYSDSPDLFFSQLLRNLHKKTGQQVVVIIDEYDKPMLDVINDPEKFSGIQNIVRSFYSQLKASAEHLHLVFLTGICKFTKTSIFSGLNNITDISLSPRAAELVGFTEEEIDKNFGPHIERLARENDISVEQARLTLRQKYNGYTFGLHLTHGPVGKVYNPFAINNAMNEGMFVERWFASGNPSMLITLLKKHNFLGVSPDSMALTLSKLELASNPLELKPTALLYFSGYLTIKDFEPRSKTLILGFPNNEVAQCLTEVLLPSLMNPNVDESLFTPYFGPLRTAVEEEEFEKVQDLINGILSHVAFAMMEHRERYYQLVLFLLFNAAHLRTSAEVMNNLGRSDLEICLPDKVIVIELKVGSSADKALEQAKDRGYANKYLASGKKIFLMGVVVGQTRREIEELVVERVC